MDDLVDSKSVIIKQLNTELLRTKGALHCRSLLERLLIEIHKEKPLKGRFNATDVCSNITLGKRGTIERGVYEAAETTMRDYHDGELHKRSGGQITEMYKQVYRTLSGEEVKRIIPGVSLTLVTLTIRFDRYSLIIL